MKSLSRYVVAALGIGALIAIAMSCGDSKPTPPPGLSETQLAGWNAYVTLDCGSCHGDQRQGKRSGPTLAGLDQHWTEEQLAAYLGDPQAMIKVTPRLAYKSEQYAIAMPAYADKADQGTLEALTSYLLVDFD